MRLKKEFYCKGSEIMKLYPELCTGKWAVVLSLGFLALLIVFFLFMAQGFVDFDTGHWWDLTVAISVFLIVPAFLLSIIAIRKEKTTLTYVVLIIGLLMIVFLLTHSLLISD